MQSISDGGADPPGLQVLTVMVKRIASFKLRNYSMPIYVNYGVWCSCMGVLWRSQGFARLGLVGFLALDNELSRHLTLTG